MISKYRTEFVGSRWVGLLVPEGCWAFRPCAWLPKWLGSSWLCSKKAKRQEAFVVVGETVDGEIYVSIGNSSTPTLS